MKINKIIFVLAILTFVLIIAISFASASGCCFYSTTGLCANNADQSSCESSSGIYSSSPTCSTSDCTRGCCTLGGSVQYITPRTCELLSDTYGFSSTDFVAGDSSYCTSLETTTTEDEGACLSGDYMPYDCRFVAGSECSTGNFFPGMTCTNPVLNTSCNSTEILICYDDDVYSQDTCGNPDAKISDCNYSSGTICDEATGTAVCKNLNCEGHANGETWCVGMNYDGAINVTYPDVGTSNGWAGFGTPIEDDPPVGSRFFTQSCIEGVVYTDPCADFRAESCLDGECKVNAWQQCLTAGNDSESCDEDYCQMFEGFRSHCVWDSTGAGFCTHGDDTTAWYPATIDGDTYTMGSMSTGTTVAGLRTAAPLPGASTSVALATLSASTTGEPLSKDEILGLEGTEYGGKSDSFLDNLLLAMCVPKLQGGIQFYPSETLSGPSTGGTTTAIDGQAAGEEVCGAGAYETNIKFKRGDHDCLYLDISELSTTYGNAALLASSPDMWQVDGTKLYGTQRNPYIYCDDEEVKIRGWVSIVTMDDFYSKLGIDWIGDSLNLVANMVLDWLPEWFTDIFVKPVYRNVGLVPAMIRGDIEPKLPLNGNAVQAMIMRCKAISDCTVQWNWLGQDVGSADWGPFEVVDAEKGLFNIECKKGGDAVTCPFEFTCVPWSAEGSSDKCHYCGEDGLPCSEYRCKAAGDGCSYKQPNGANQGYCVASGDNTAPTITLKSMIPSSPIPPYTPVQIDIGVSETAKCKFDINQAAATFDEMSYDFGDAGYAMSHSVTLTLPGQTYGLNLSDYPLLTTDGEYTMYVRCVDVSGNGDAVTAYPINFEIMQYPDAIPPAILSANPVSGSKIRFNTTTKYVTFQISEPAECRWDLYETYNYSTMNNSLSCDTIINSDPTAAYTCSGTLTNITMNMTEQTRFYIRCKDQPWLEGIEDATYQRNTNDISYEYLLLPSEELLITELSPSGTIIRNEGNLTVDLFASTDGGAYNGQATCFWRTSNQSDFSGSTFTIFGATNSDLHRQNLTGLSEGVVYSEVTCNDSAQNEARINTSFNLEIDRGTPLIYRIYEYRGALKVETNEDSMCYSSTNQTTACSFVMNTSNIMTGYETEHTTAWDYGNYYYIKCKDYFGNEDSYCSQIVRTY